MGTGRYVLDPGVHVSESEATEIVASKWERLEAGRKVRLESLLTA